MKHVTLADKSLLLGDMTADLLVEYAKLLGQEGSADSVEVHAISSDGNEAFVTFLLNSGLTIVTETTTSMLPEPDNSKADQYMQSQIVRLNELRTFSVADIAGAAVWGTEERD